MSQETLPEKLKKLLAGGMTYKAVADRASCDTSTIFRIKNGDIANPSYSVGTAIDALYEEHCKRSAA
ncbi:helix-turn-helix domain-containing protein [Metapseudomonas otitidis]|jgi:transcriptional regulator with XRE-family HTH domain|uniref:Helix-turn-helix n=1 Tax=Metapseudomonas otitidis TaxID=319939 RepID=A0A7X3KV02_9GAMM|nr:helix-turn-helix transcriptional regulator [Pseudomonas otitidis]MCO7556170.1 helix-turn-helix domain-containing protein [Pseudomonas otitidis]MWK56932.1 hypothetical protein [Pseudomonas otitidis]